MKIFIVLTFLIVPSASAGIYKWTDSDGNIHFGDRPDTNDSATELNIKINKNTGVTNSSGYKKEREYLLKKIEKDKKEEAEKRKKKLAADKKRKKRCDSYRRSYQSHIQSSRTYSMTPDGVKTYLSNEERLASKKRLSKGISKYCR